jgi:carotenoid 1,2-hydratase
MSEARVLRTLEDTPFYARSLVQADWCGQTVTAMHETLDAQRFASPWCSCCCPGACPARMRPLCLRRIALRVSTVLFD